MIIHYLLQIPENLSLFFLLFLNDMCIAIMNLSYQCATNAHIYNFLEILSSEMTLFHSVFSLSLLCK